MAVIDNEIRDVMFTSELDVLSISGLQAGKEYEFAAIDQDYNHPFCNLTLVADNYSHIELPRFDEILNDYLATTPTAVGFFIGGTQIGQDVCFVPARIRAMEPAETYVKRYPLSAERGVKTCFLDHAEILPVFLMNGSYTLTVKVMCEGKQYQKTQTIYIEDLHTSRELLIDPIQILKGEGLDPKSCNVEARLTGNMVDIRQEYNFVRPPYGGKTLLFVNSFAHHECIPVVSSERKTKAERFTANIKGKETVYKVKDNTTWDILSYPLRDGEEEMAADFIRSKEITDEKGIFYNVKDGELSVKSEMNEFVQMKATIQQQQKNLTFDGRVPRIFDATFDDTFE